MKYNFFFISIYLTVAFNWIFIYCCGYLYHGKSHYKELRAKVPQRIPEPSKLEQVEHSVDPFEKVRETMQDELRAKVPQRIPEQN